MSCVWWRHPCRLCPWQASIYRLPVGDNMKVLGVMLDRRLTFHKHVSTVARSCNYHAQAIRHIRTCWLRNLHRHWIVVWSCQGLTTAMLCSTALQTKASRSCNGYRTTRLGSYFKSLDDCTPWRYSGSCTGCPFSSGSTTKWPCWRSRSTAHRRLCTFDAWSRGGSTSRTYDPPPCTSLSQPSSRTTFAKHAFHCTAPAIWNSLPKTVIDSDSITVF